MNCKISVYNIDYQATTDEIREFFELVGPLKEMPNIKREDNDQKKGTKVTAEVTYADQELAYCAFKNLNGKKLKGREVKIRYLDEEQTQKQDGDDNFYQYLEQKLGRQDKLFLMQELQSLIENDRGILLSYLQKNPKFTETLFKIQSELGINQQKTVVTNFSKIQAPNLIQNQARQEMRNPQVAPLYQQQQQLQAQHQISLSHSQQNLQPNMISKQDRNR
ncbi:hypothetical protein PPERSA_06285 [Pseudocohnilembus persalinus]|uniref:RRM domain-containing protein n=1 Tax=Pseudocohnilembus persalinus TaxID=266149 RepID=A0A0V0QW83_PSEPJ|nr:hypothetical protein PPERSA_06285 [Pseudocohnilembus persalinus]|eukprot:KRX06314.1 hypothetical protein PPERSA_06285 [Pseudocohnilembus persalinus]